jgi:hypothetical protein
MAKRYIKIGWENKPSVKTPVNMANLGRMDKGIDDCDNAIEEIYAKRVNNVVTTNEDTFLAGPVGKVLQDQVTELNKNLDYTNYAISPSAGITIIGNISRNNRNDMRINLSVTGVALTANQGKNIGTTAMGNIATIPLTLVGVALIGGVYKGLCSLNILGGVVFVTSSVDISSADKLNFRNYT